MQSLESQNLLKKKILPLLYKNLNLVPDEINEVKLLKLFKGKRSSNMSLEMPETADDMTSDDDDLVYQLKISKKLFDLFISLRTTEAYIKG